MNLIKRIDKKNPHSISHVFKISKSIVNEDDKISIATHICFPVWALVLKKVYEVEEQENHAKEKKIRWYIE